MSEAPPPEPQQAEPPSSDSTTQEGSPPLNPAQSIDNIQVAAPPKTYDLSNRADVLALIRSNNDELTKQCISDHITKIIKSHGLDSYTVVMLFDDVDPISSFHANQVYDATSAAGGLRDVLLILQSAGGSIEPAYLLSKTCKRLAKKKFSVAVARKAKSAATLIALGADEIHLGYMSELGPIDPQIEGYPALGLANALNKIAQLACQFPQSADMWATYLHKNLNLRDVGYLERLSESAVQYAERLLRDKPVPKSQTPLTLAKHFVEHYKDHGFVIDLDEAKSLLGSDIVKSGTPEYQCANDIYMFLDFVEYLLRVFNRKTIYHVGTVYDGLVIQEKK